MKCQDCKHDDNIHTDAGCTAEPFCGCRKSGESIRMDASRDPLIERAKTLSTIQGYVSVSYLQRIMRIGYMRAARLVDLMIEDGFCEPDHLGTYRYQIKVTP